MHQIYWAFDKYTSNLNISFNCLYISHFNEELPNIIVAEIQIISDLSEIWINAIYAPNSERFKNRHLIWTFHCNCLYLSHFYEELPNNLAPLNIKSIPINLKFELMQHMQQITERLTTRVRIWTFHCNCLYISHFNEELSNIIVAELQIISDRSEI